MAKNKTKVEAAKVAAVESLSTVKSSEEALGRAAKRKANNEQKQAGDSKRPDIRDREDIDRRIESPERLYRELDKVERTLGALRKKKRELLLAILAFRQGDANPGKELIRQADEYLAKKVAEQDDRDWKAAEAAAKKEKKNAPKAKAKPAKDTSPKDGGDAEADAAGDERSAEDPEDVQGADSGDGSVEAPE